LTNLFGSDKKALVLRKRLRWLASRALEIGRRRVRPSRLALLSGFSSGKFRSAERTCFLNGVSLLEEQENRENRSIAFMPRKTRGLSNQDTGAENAARPAFQMWRIAADLTRRMPLEGSEAPSWVVVSS